MKAPVPLAHVRDLRVLAVALLPAACALVAASPVRGQDLDPDTPVFTPFTVAPQIQNRPEVQEAVVEAYPSDLREAGIGGTTTVWFLIGSDGGVVNHFINRSSGVEALDDAAMRVADVYRFSPAMNRENRVAVWVALPITFDPRRSSPPARE